MSLQTCFFYNDEGNRNNNKFRLRVGVFRLNSKGIQYRRESNTIINIRRYNSSATQSCTSMDLPDPVPVLEGDRLAVYILDGCSNNACPVQPNLNIAAETSIFFMPSFSVRKIPVSKVMATKSYTNVYLDVRASIGEFRKLL